MQALSARSDVQNTVIFVFVDNSSNICPESGVQGTVWGMHSRQGSWRKVSYYKFASLSHPYMHEKES